MRAQKQKAIIDPITSAIITVFHKGIAQNLWMSSSVCPDRNLFRSGVTASFSFPSAAPSDAKHWPFSGIARVSQARESFELIPCIRRQIPGIALADSDPQNRALRFLSAFLRL